MRGPIEDDERLMAVLAESLREVRPLVDRVGEFGRGAFTWRDVDQDLLLAALSYDSTGDALAVGRAGADDDPRILIFESAPLSVELEVHADRLIGQLVPPGPGRVVIEDVDGNSVVVTPDDFGYFAVVPLPGKRCRIRCETRTGKLVTEWMLL